jgi:hypothetical protein
MPSRLPKPSAALFNWALAFFAGGVITPPLALATLTVKGVSPYSITSAGVINYAAFKTSGASISGGFVDTDAGFKFIDLTSTSTSSTDNIILFDIQSNKSFGTLTTGQDVVLMATVTINSTQVPIPIAYAGGAFCATGGNSRCQAVSSSKYYAAKYSISGGNEVLRVGLYPKDLCASPLNNTGTISGCTSGEVDEPSGTALKTLTVRFYLSVEDTTQSNPELGKIADSEENKTITIQLQQAAPTLTCPANIASLYTPGDQEINFNGANLTTAAASSGGSTVGASVDTLIFLAKEDPSTPTTGSGFAADTAQIVARVSSGSPGVISGFTNTSTGTDHVYNVAIHARDRAGVVSDAFAGEAGSGCTAGPTTEYQVQTSSIRGLLVESKCFIATAAFGSAHAAPVLLLRRFRDEFLLQHAAGKLFVSTYYRYSPALAEWLLKHSEWRGVVLQALILVQIWAWLVLHPAWVLLVVGCVTALLISRSRRGRIALLLLLAIGNPWSAQAEEGQAGETDFSFIEEIQQRQKEEAGAAAEADKGSPSFIQKKKSELKEGEDYSLIDEVKEVQPVTEPGSEKDSASWVEQKKKQLSPKVEGGAIRAVQEGKSEPHAQRDEKLGRSFGIKIWTSGTREISAPSSVFYRSFDSLYGSSYTPDFRFFYESQLVHSEWFVSLGWFFETGFAWKKAPGGFEFAPQNPSGGTYGTSSSVNFTFVTVPVAVGGMARFNLLRLLRPQIKVAPVAVGYFEDRSDSKGIKRGYSRGLLTEAGLAFQLDWLDRRGSWSMYEMFRVNQHFLTLDYQRLDTASGDVDFSFHGLTLGLLFEI